MWRPNQQQLLMATRQIRTRASTGRNKAPIKVELVQKAPIKVEHELSTFTFYCVTLWVFVLSSA